MTASVSGTFSTAELDVDVEGDPSRTLVAAQLQAYDSEGRVDAQTVLLLARLSETAGENIAINALVNVWRRRIPFAPEGMPWWYLPPSPKSKWVRTGGNPNLALLITDPNSTTETSVHFQTDDEPMVAYVLERVKSACETRVVFEKIPHEIGAGTPLVKAAYVSPGALHPALELILEDSD